MKKGYIILFFVALMMVGQVARATGSVEVVVGAQRVKAYEPLLRGKRIALLSNQSGLVWPKCPACSHECQAIHTLDFMLENGLKVTRLYSPEHGFRGKEEAGAKVDNAKDEKTGIPIVSLYGNKSPIDLTEIDAVVVDIQDVGLRFYTYYITMLKLMNAAVTSGCEFYVFDRPNPNGMYVDGPVLDMKYKSGVGALPIPVVHGMTLGELALMANGEGWIKGKLKVLKVIKCTGYTHQTRYRLPVAPSPNLPNMKSVYLYPSLCLFEATKVSIGRGTDFPFQVYGAPNMDGPFKFTPRSVPASTNPPCKGLLCKGRDLRSLEDEDIISQQINLEYLIDAYDKCGRPDKFLSPFFEKLIGSDKVRAQIMKGWSAERIKAAWAPEVEQFKTKRKPYLLYAE